MEINDFCAGFVPKKVALVYLVCTLFRWVDWIPVADYCRRRRPATAHVLSIGR